ncbi:hypothetical protein [Marinovum algicola]|uniref:hypothetical protein n=1 Tax=Marinovum algicola TaxID=42444 RepID=UPI0024B90BAA|nr:hypothetical protein [Marinovum algicola]
MSPMTRTNTPAPAQSCRRPAPPCAPPAPGGATDEIEDDGFITVHPPLPRPRADFTARRLAAARAALAAPSDHNDAVLYEACWIVGAYSMDPPEIADAAALAARLARQMEAAA